MKTSQSKITTFIKELDKHTDFPAKYVLYTLGITFALILLNFMPFELTNALGFILPVYWTVKSLENNTKTSNNQWSTYWILYFIMFGMDFLLGDLLSKIPLFYFSKALFLTWMSLPNLEGASYLYNKYLYRLVASTKIDEKIKNFAKTAEAKIEDKLNKNSHKKVTAYDNEALRKTYSESHVTAPVFNNNFNKINPFAKQNTEIISDKSDKLAEIKEKINKKAEIYNEKIKKFNENAENKENLSLNTKIN